MAEDQDKAQKTEEPTPKRIEEAIKRGNVAFSREVTSFIMILILTLIAIFASPFMLKNAVFNLSPYVTDVHNFNFDYDADDLGRLAIKIVLEFGLILAIPFLLSFLGTFLSSFLQNGIIYSPEAINPDLSKISPLTGLKRLFSMKSIMEFIKGLIKITVIGITAYLAVKDDFDSLMLMSDLSMKGALDILLSITSKMLMYITGVLFVVAVLDLLYEKYRYKQSLMMTREELKEEMKQSDGNPEVKAKLRAIRAQRVKKGLMQRVPKADVIITNPTHFSVALKYDREKMPAPTIIAKGADKAAFTIREIAKKHEIPIVESPPLARALFDTSEVDEFVPHQHFQAVAEILVKLRKYKKAPSR